MSTYPGIRYFFHDGCTYIVPHYTNASGLATMFNLAREAAHRDMVMAGADHAIYGVKRYDPKTGTLSEADIYAPAVLLDDAEFTKRTDAETEKYPNCLILALHAR
ncbi:MAG: hypothetical protein ACI3V4_08185 [Faecousia sp.]